MLVLTTWQTWLRYGLDLMTKDDVAAAIYYIACEQIKYDVTGVPGASRGSQIRSVKVLWPNSELSEFMIYPKKYREYLENTSSTPIAAMGEIMMTALSTVCYLFVGDLGNHRQTSGLVNVLQEYFYDCYGIGTIWLDGLIYDGDPNEYIQDEERLKESYRRHLRMCRRVRAQSQSPSGILYRDTRMTHLNSMSEADQRKYLQKHHHINTSGMDASTVYEMMVDLFVEETDGKGRDNLKETIRSRYKQERKKKL